MFNSKIDLELVKSNLDVIYKLVSKGHLTLYTSPKREIG